MTRTVALACAVCLLTAAGIFLAVQQGRSLRASRALDQLPNTARVVLAIDTDALSRSESATILVDAFIDESQLSDIEARCGLDPVDDLSEIVLWVRGSDRRSLEAFGVQLEGRDVDSATLAACHASLVGERGHSVVRVESSTGPLVTSEDRRSALAVVDDRTVVTGSVHTVAEAMAVRRGLAPSLRERGTVDDVWPEIRKNAAIAGFVDLPDHWKAALERIAPFDESPELFDAVRTFALSAKVGVAPVLELRMDTASAQAALELAEHVRGWAARPPSGVEPPWTRVLESAEVRTEGPTATVTLDVSALRREPALR